MDRGIFNDGGLPRRKAREPRAALPLAKAQWSAEDGEANRLPWRLACRRESKT